MGTIYTVSPDGRPAFARTYFFSTLDEALEALRAADTLGMGSVLRNREDLDEEDPDGESYTSVWVLEATCEPPTYSEA